MKQAQGLLFVANEGKFDFPMVSLMEKRFFKLIRTILIALMIAIANVYKGEIKTIEDTYDKIEHVEDIKEDKDL